MRKSVLFWGNQSNSKSRCSWRNAATASCDVPQADQGQNFRWTVHRPLEQSWSSDPWNVGSLLSRVCRVWSWSFAGRGKKKKKGWSFRPHPAKIRALSAAELLRVRWRCSGSPGGSGIRVRWWQQMFGHERVCYLQLLSSLTANISRRASITVTLRYITELLSRLGHSSCSGAPDTSSTVCFFYFRSFASGIHWSHFLDEFVCFLFYGLFVMMSLISEAYYC